METATTTNFFSGASIPKNYDEHLVPILFAPYGLDLSRRISITKSIKVLELASGTGVVTKHIVEKLPESSQLTATDISQEMLDIAKTTITNPIITWEIVDMTAIRYDDTTFDVVICQFGLMFAPDKQKALAEMHRVLKKGGQLLFNTWGDIHENPLFDSNFRTLQKYLGELPFQPEMNPFSLSSGEEVMDFLDRAGFQNIKSERLTKTATIQSPETAAEAFLSTSPALAKNPELFREMSESFAKDLSENIGVNATTAPMLALVFEAIK